jgi:YD repeat-containing protein
VARATLGTEVSLRVAGVKCGCGERIDDPHAPAPAIAGCLLGLGFPVAAPESNIDDEPTSVTDAQNVVTTRTFDYLGRVLTRKQGTLPNEVFTYTARGLTNHTDQLGKLTKYTFDAALRKTAETTPNSETVTYTHNAAGNVLTLTDHRGRSPRADVGAAAG